MGLRGGVGEGLGGAMGGVIGVGRGVGRVDEASACSSSGSAAIAFSRNLMSRVKWPLTILIINIHAHKECP